MISLTAIEKIAKKSGVKRISKDALEEMRDTIEEIATDIAEQANRIARHAGRKTVMKEDVEFIIKRK